MNHSRYNISLILILILLGVGVYSFNLNNELFWDDDDWIVNNNFVHAISWDNVKFWFTNNVLAGVGLKSNYYRPFLFVTFALNYVLAGVKPLIYHLTSNAIHIFNAILVFWLINQVFKKRLMAFLTALFFLIHPLQTEAVTYIAGRGDNLVAMFMFLALLFFHKSELLKSNLLNSAHPKSIFYFLFSIFFLILGLLSRETGIIFPLLALAFYVAIISRESFLKSIKAGLIKTWPYFLVVIIYGILRLTVLNFLNVLNFYIEPNIYSENLHIRIFTFLPVLWEYLKLLIVPIGLHMERSNVVFTSLFQWPVWGVFLTLLGLAGWLAFLYKKERLAIRNSKSEILNFPEQVEGQIPNSQIPNLTPITYNLKPFRVWLFGVGWFFIAFLPVSGITPINAVMYEHWLYLPIVGFWLIVSFYLVKFFSFLKNKNSIFYFLFSIFLIVYFSFLGYQAIQRNILWGNQEKFYQDILKYEPDSVRINNNLGNLYYNQKNVEKAEKYYRQAIEAKDVFPQPHFNIGGILQSRGDIFGAIKEYEKAIEIDPNFFHPYQNLAVIYAQQGNLPKAKENIEVLKSLLPTNPRVFYNSALVYIALNNRAQAFADLKEGFKHSNLDPETAKLIEELIKRLQK